MQTAVAANYQRRAGFIAGIEIVAGEDVHARHLEGAKIPLCSNWSEKGNNSHGAKPRTLGEKSQPRRQQ